MTPTADLIVIHTKAFDGTYWFLFHPGQEDSVKRSAWRMHRNPELGFSEEHYEKICAAVEGMRLKWRDRR